MQFSRDAYVKTLKYLFVRQMTKVVDGILVADFPFLATPILKQLMDQMIGYVIGKVANAAETQAFFIYSDFRVSQQGRDFVASAEKHQDALKNGTPEEKAQTEAAMFRDFQNLVMWKA